MRNFLKLFLLSLFVLMPVAAYAQVFDPLSKSLGGTVTGRILYAGGIPVVTGTGTPSILTGSTNVAGRVTAGASATSVIITFANGGWGSVPTCVVGSQTQLAAFAYTVSATAITITQTATSGNLINYRCDPLA
jgi:hypothetical protein